MVGIEELGAELDLGARQRLCAFSGIGSRPSGGSGGKLMCVGCAV